MSSDKPIGVFDSGLGGLTAVRELRRLLPGEDIVYFGDTGRVPYGTKGRDIIIRYAKQDIEFLCSKNVKYILAACGTVSSTFPQEEAAKLPVGYAGVVESTAAAAAAATRNGVIGIIGTEATVASGSYQAALRRLKPELETVAMACPLLVPLVENGRFGPDDPMAAIAVSEYLQPIQAAGVDTLILGCTHYPLLTPLIRRQVGKGIALIDPGREAAIALRQELARRDLLNDRATGGRMEYYVTDDPTRFGRLARIFLGKRAAGRVTKVDIEAHCLD